MTDPEWDAALDKFKLALPAALALPGGAVVDVYRDEYMAVVSVTLHHEGGRRRMTTDLRREYAECCVDPGLYFERALKQMSARWTLCKPEAR